MHIGLSYLLFLLFPVFTWASLELPADREGKTYYSSRADLRSMNRALREVSEQDLEIVFQDILTKTDPSKVCSFDLVSSLRSELKKINTKFSHVDGAIVYLRTKNFFDDVIAGLLLSAEKTTSRNVLLPKDYRDLISPPNQDAITKAIELIKNFEPKLKNQCLDEAYRMLYAELLRTDKSIKDIHLEALFLEAFENKVISFETYLTLEKARLSKLQAGSLTIKNYLKKIRTLRIQFPLRDPLERSQFVTEKSEGDKISRRQRLLENYSELQIILMADVIKKLRKRLEAEKAEILIYDRNQGVEAIALGPMERFRLAIKLLRKEMALLALNTFFNGRTPDYMDLMVAAYETGMLPASELDAVAGLEDIWNPEKTFWDKASVWVRTLSSVATIAIPPPYGFIPALAVVVIEMTAGKKQDGKSDDPTVLF
jgi:hypothetical protein